VVKTARAEYSLIMIRLYICIICIFGCISEWYKIDLVSLWLNPQRGRSIGPMDRRTGNGNTFASAAWLSEKHLALVSKVSTYIWCKPQKFQSMSIMAISKNPNYPKSLSIISPSLHTLSTPSISVYAHPPS